MILNIIMRFSSVIVSSSRSEDGGCAMVCGEDGSLCIHDWANLFCCGNGQGQGLLNDAVALPRQTTKCSAGFRPCSSLLVEKNVFNVTFSFGDLSSSSHRCFHCLLHNPAMVRCCQWPWSGVPSGARILQLSLWFAFGGLGDDLFTRKSPLSTGTSCAVTFCARSKGWEGVQRPQIFIGRIFSSQRIQTWSWCRPPSLSDRPQLSVHGSLVWMCQWCQWCQWCRVRCGDWDVSVWIQMAVPNVSKDLSSGVIHLILDYAPPFLPIIGGTGTAPECRMKTQWQPSMTNKCRLGRRLPVPSWRSHGHMPHQLVRICLTYPFTGSCGVVAGRERAREELYSLPACGLMHSGIEKTRWVNT